MKYRLKDLELQEKLDAISGGDFSKRLQDPAKSEEGFAVAYGDFHEINGLRHLSLFLADEIEEVPEYDPNAWNEWPDVKPPEGVDMRVEVLSKDGEVIFKGASVFVTDAWNIGGHWYDDRRVRFRPWDDATSTLSKKMLQEIVTALESHPEAYELGYLIDAVDEAANELPDEEGEK